MRTVPRFRRTVVLAALLLTMTPPTVIAACGHESGDASSASRTKLASGKVSTTLTSEISQPAVNAPLTGAQAVSASIQAFGADLYRILAVDAGDGNFVFAPADIASVLAMTYAGATGPTAEAMARTLHLTLEGDDLHEAFRSLSEDLESRNLRQGDKRVVLMDASSLWGQADVAFQQPFLETLAANYGAGMQFVDYDTAPDSACQAINSWVLEQTEGKVANLLDEGVLDANTLLVLVTAAYLEATWGTEFDAGHSRYGDFTNLAGQTVDVPMMQRAAEAPYARGTGWQAVELSYFGDELAMLLIVPDEGDFSGIEDRLADGLIHEALSQLSEDVTVFLTMPKFDFQTRARLDQALTTMGMGIAFDPAAADFDRMAAEHGPWIGAVMHEAFIGVDEDGTEAGAATAVEMEEGTTTTLPETVELTIDRPFLFALYDRETGAILFMGRVADPTK